MAVRVGSKYQHLIGAEDCQCCDPRLNHFTLTMNADVSRRGFLIGAAAVAGAGLATAARAESAPPKGVLFENVRIFDGKSDALSPTSNVLVVGKTIKSTSARADRGSRRWHGCAHRGRRPDADAGPDRCAYAHHVRDDSADGDPRCRHRLRECRRRQGRRRHADAGVHLDPRSRRTFVRAEARHRCGPRSGAAHLALGRVHFAVRRPWRLPLSNDLPAPPGRYTYSERTGAGNRRRSRYSSQTRARAACPRGVADQDDGGRRRIVELRSARRHAIHGSGTACGVEAAENWGTYAPSTPTRRERCGRR